MKINTFEQIKESVHNTRFEVITMYFGKFMKINLKKLTFIFRLQVL